MRYDICSVDTVYSTDREGAAHNVVPPNACSSARGGFIPLTQSDACVGNRPMALSLYNAIARPATWIAQNASRGPVTSVFASANRSKVLPLRMMAFTGFHHAAAHHHHREDLHAVAAHVHHEPHHPDRTQLGHGERVGFLLPDRGRERRLVLVPRHRHAMLAVVRLVSPLLAALRGGRVRRVGALDLAQGREPGGGVRDGGAAGGLRERHAPLGVHRAHRGARAVVAALAVRTRPVLPQARPRISKSSSSRTEKGFFFRDEGFDCDDRRSREKVFVTFTHHHRSRRSGRVGGVCPRASFSCVRTYP